MTLDDGALLHGSRLPPWAASYPAFLALLGLEKTGFFAFSLTRITPELSS